MKLIKIEAHGFKSFADPVTLRFDGGVMAIIGPNGSGKSNINDAIKWVLGEQSYKELRGNNMMDVIFSGSKTQKAMDKATVSLTFDNRERLSSFDAEYITITRELNRKDKGISNYYINGEKRTAKEIKKIAMETGIGKSSLAIISQGKVSEIAQSSDENRRGIFEEAAGISKFKAEKEEAERNLDRTEQKLETINAAIVQLEKRLKPLKEKCEKALIYRSKKEELKKVEIGFLAHEINVLTENNKELDEQASGAKETLAKYAEDLEKYEVKILQTKQELKDINAKINNIDSSIKVKESKKSSIEKAYQKANLKNEMILSGEMKVSKEETLKVAYAKCKEIEKNIKYYEEELEQEITKYNNLVKERDESNTKYAELSAKLLSANSKITLQAEELKKLESIKRENTHLSRGVKTIVENASLFSGFKGLVSDLFNVKEGFIRAIDAIISLSSQNVVVDDENTAARAINFLKKNKGGRATFIPLASIKPKSIRDDHYYALRNVSGFLGSANEFVEAKEEFYVLRDFLFGNIIITEDIKDANNISALAERRYMVVTKDGDVVRTGGVIVGGELKEINTDLNIDQKIAEKRAWLEKANPIYIKNKEVVLEIQKEVNAYNTQVSTSLGIINSFKTDIQKFKKDLQDIKLQAGIGINDDSDNVADNEQEQLILLSNQLNLISAEIRDLEFDKNALIQNKSDYEADLEDLEKIQKTIYKDNDKLNKTFGATINTLERNKIKLEKYINCLRNEYELTLEFALENYPLIMDIELTRQVVENLHKEIEDLGSVDESSIEEYDEVNNEFTSKTNVRNEIKDAADKYRTAIQELEYVMIDKLTKVLSDVNYHFNDVFVKLFGGGNASATLIDPSDPLNSGIAIKVQPPGKTIKNLNLLSGGEKSLTAISLLFAILRARPLPLCILDEAEGALDEANVIRYADYLQELKDQTQFLVITHRHGTMTKADGIIAATMQNRGVTTFLRINVDDAKKMVDKFEEKTEE